MHFHPCPFDKQRPFAFASIVGDSNALHKPGATRPFAVRASSALSSPSFLVMPAVVGRGRSVCVGPVLPRAVGRRRKGRDSLFLDMAPRPALPLSPSLPLPLRSHAHLACCLNSAGVQHDANTETGDAWGGGTRKRCIVHCTCSK